jgi:mannose/cellobiose epimerase-like protein (N-acyl-D-glucosamine 2-epimerase family)
MKTRRRILVLTLAVISSTFAPAAAQESPRAARDWSAEFRQNLQGGILRFWIDHATDREYGGMIGGLDRKGNPIPPGTKSLVQQARYTLDHFVDREYGEWYNTIEPDGKITGEKTSEWKAPYHAGRACLEVIRRLREKH